MADSTLTTEDTLRKKLAEIKKLPAEKRMAAIRKFEEEMKKLDAERKRELEEAEEAGRQSLQEMDALSQIVPEQKPINMQELFEKKPEELEKKLENVPELPAGAGGKEYNTPFEEAKRDFYRLLEARPAINSLAEKAANDELNPADIARIESYKQAIDRFSAAANYVSEQARESFLNEQKQIGIIGSYMNKTEEETAAKRRRY